MPAFIGREVGKRALVPLINKTLIVVSGGAVLTLGSGVYDLINNDIDPEATTYFNEPEEGTASDGTENGGEDDQSADEDESEGTEYSGHGEDPEGDVGDGSAGWNKHSSPRSGTRYGKGRNEKRGNRNKKYERPPNPNKRNKDS